MLYLHRNLHYILLTASTLRWGVITLENAQRDSSSIDLRYFDPGILGFSVTAGGFQEIFSFISEINRDTKENL